MVCIVCIGDSIVEGEGDKKGLSGWVGRLSTSILKNSKVGENRVYNLGVGMETSIDLLHRLYSEVLYRKPDIIILQAAHGDSRFMKNNSGENEYEIGKKARMRTYNRIFEFLSKSNLNVLILGLNPVCDEKYNKDELEFYKKHNESTRKGLKLLCSEYNLPFLDPKEDIFKDKNLNELYEDGIHPNSKGYDIMFTKINEKLKE